MTDEEIMRQVDLINLDYELGEIEATEAVDKIRDVLKERE